MQTLILCMDLLTAIAAFMAGYLWFKASGVRHGLEKINDQDGYNDEFYTLKQNLKLQGSMNARAALWSCFAAVIQGILFLVGIFR